MSYVLPAVMVRTLRSALGVPTGPTAFIIIDSVYYIFAVVAAIIVSRRVGFSWQTVVGKKPRFKDIASGLILLIPLFLVQLGAFWPWNLILSYLDPGEFAAKFAGKRRAVVVWSEQSDFWIVNAVRFASISIISPAVEEMLFRGIVLRTIAIRWSLNIGIFISSIAFGILHYSGGNPIGATAFGIAMAILYLRSGSLLVPCCTHMLNNASVFVSLYLAGPRGPGTTWTVPILWQTLIFGMILLWVGGIWLAYYCLDNWPARKRRAQG